MTREMNKPDWEQNWTYNASKDWFELNKPLVHRLENETDEQYRERIKPSNSRELDEWIKPFFENCCRMEKLK